MWIFSFEFGGDTNLARFCVCLLKKGLIAIFANCWFLATNKSFYYCRIVPITAHAAFDKAAGYFRMKITHIPVDDSTRQVNISAMKRAINKNTCMVSNILSLCNLWGKAIQEMFQFHLAKPI